MEKGTTAAEQSQYKDMRYLCEMLRKLGYPRVVSLDSFKKPNFQLVAEILDHLAQRIDPSADYPTSIDSMADRVRFMKAVCGLIASKARIKISAINLYSADFHAVPELTKIASMLYGVYTSMNSSTEHSRQTFSIPVKYNKTAVRDMANDIDSIAQRVFEVLGKEDQLKEKRMEAIKFIDKLSKNYSGEEQVYIKECVEKLITQQKESVSAMEGYVKTLQEDERTLEEKIKKKNLDIERAIKRLKAMDKKPAHMEEMEARERELEKLFTEYMEKFKNLDHLNQLVDVYNAKESEKREKEKSALSSLQRKMQSEEDKLMNLDEKKVSNGGGAGAGGKKLAVRGNLRGDAV